MASAFAELVSSFANDPVLQNEPLELNVVGLESFVEQLNDRIRRADGKIDLGFAKSQTDIYRFRHLVLGATAATRLTTSPALASIAQGTSAVATQRDLSDFLETLGKPRPVAVRPLSSATWGKRRDRQSGRRPGGERSHPRR